MSEEYLFHTRRRTDLLSYPCRAEKGEFLFCLQGEVQIYINQQKYALSAGSVILVFPGQITLYKDATEDLELTVFPVSSGMRFSIRCLRIKCLLCASIITVHSRVRNGTQCGITIWNCYTGSLRTMGMCTSAN